MNSHSSSSDDLLIERIRRADPDAWTELIDRYEGRLLAYVRSRLRDRAAGEDVVQETFIGFLTSLPNFVASRPLESYLFSIAAYKLTDHLRREGRRPAIPISSTGASDGPWDLPGSARPASSIARSGERRGLEIKAIRVALEAQIASWQKRSDWQKIQCMELLFVCGWSNKRAAETLDLTEQQVANFKFDFLARLRSSIAKQGLSVDIFPELHEASS